LNKLIGYPKMLEEAKQSKRKAHIWIVEILIFLLVFTVASYAESIPVSIATFASCFSENAGRLSEILQNEGILSYYYAFLEIFNEAMSSSLVEIVALFATVFGTVIGILYCVVLEKRSIASMGFRKRNWFLEYLGGAAVGIASISVAALIGILTGGYSFSLAKPQAWWLILFFFGFIVQGMSEEVLCRGYLMVSMSRKTPVIVCVILTSVIFALMHIFNPGFGLIPFINLVLSGLSFAIYVLKRGNIWGACAMHTFWNFYQGPIFGISVSGTGATENAVLSAITNPLSSMNIWTGGDFGIEGSLCVTIAEVLTLVFVLFLLPKSKEEQFVPVKEEQPVTEAQTVAEEQPIAEEPSVTVEQTVTVEQPVMEDPSAKPEPEKVE